MLRSLRSPDKLAMGDKFMNDMSGTALAEQPDSAFRFTGTWREFAPIAFTNLLLTIVTLGIYRFWAQARVRRYLWGRTEFIDDMLEWTGTGKEMFLGFLLAAVILVPILVGLQFGLEALILRGQTGLATIAGLLLYGGLLYLVGVATYRALRYRLSRTWWRGIRGGGAPGGWDYGWSWLWKSIAGFFVMGLLVPWSMTQLWNERWNRMSFGPLEFSANASTEGLMGRWILLLVSPIVILVVGTIVATAGFFSAAGGTPQPPSEWQLLVLGTVFILGFYALIALIGVGYYAAYFRQVIGQTTLGELHFGFEARSKDWLMLFLGNIALAVVTLGIGTIFWSYRNWSFFVRHLEAYGEVDPALLTQSTAAQTGDAEGLAAMFDIGAV